ncbi:MAG TPA: hypothetical protein PKZ76_11840 [Xanthomonadaceae bacterium]|nr:hypothetical protein [Xanthomonadaceae bacterium]
MANSGHADVSSGIATIANDSKNPKAAKATLSNRAIRGNAAPSSSAAEVHTTPSMKTVVAANAAETLRELAAIASITTIGMPTPTAHRIAHKRSRSGDDPGRWKRKR